MIWFLSQVGKAIDCNSMTVGSNPTGTSIQKKTKKLSKIACNLTLIVVYYISIALIAQLDRVSDYESGGCEFDSCLARHSLYLEEITDLTGNSTAW